LHRTSSPGMNLRQQPTGHPSMHWLHPAHLTRCPPLTMCLACIQHACTLHACYFPACLPNTNILKPAVLSRPLLSKPHHLQHETLVAETLKENKHGTSFFHGPATWLTSRPSSPPKGLFHSTVLPRTPCSGAPHSFWDLRPAGAARYMCVSERGSILNTA
jgi:hypothetical protein